MALSEIDRRVAVTTAQFAARQRLPITSCPYNPVGDDRSRALAVLWVRIFRRTRPD